MSSAFLKAVKAHVRIECDDGTVYEMDLVEDLPMDLEVSLSIDTEPVETTYDDIDAANWPTWRTYAPGPRTGSVTLRGRLGDARFTRPAESEREPSGGPGTPGNGCSGADGEMAAAT